MFGALLILASSVLFLVKNDKTQAAAVSTEPNDLGSQKRHVILYAVWSASTALSVVIFSITFIALLNRPHDKPKTLVINSRWIRLAPRIPATVAIMCLPLIKDLTGSSWCGGVTLTVYAVFLWELVAGLEKDWKFFQPKDEEYMRVSRHGV
jgi:hypothetical protein